MEKVLNEQGLTHLWSKIEDKIAAGSGGAKVYKFSSSMTFTDENIANLKALVNDLSVPVYIDNIIVSQIYWSGTFLQFRTYQIKGVGGDIIKVYKVNFNSNGEVISPQMQFQMQYYVATSSVSVDGTILTTSNFNTEMPGIGSSLWKSAVPSDSNLYNAKEIVLFAQNIYGNKAQAYYNFSRNPSGGPGSLGVDYQNVSYNFFVTNDSFVTWQYNGSEIVASPGLIELVLYRE